MALQSNSILPRVLVLTNNKFQQYTAGGGILRSLFYEYPRENLFVVHSDAPDGTIPDYKEHRLRGASMRPGVADSIRLFATFIREALSAPASVRAGDLNSLAFHACHFTFPREVDAAIRAFRPQVIYAWVGDSPWARLLKHCAHRYDVPYVIHFMDNHVELEGNTAAQRAIYSHFRRNLTRVVARADRLFVISDAMAEAYEKKFRKRAEVFHMLIDRAAWPWPLPRSDARAGEFSLVFTGSIESSQVDGLKDVIAAAERLASEGRRIELVLYVTEFYEKNARAAFGDSKHVRYVRHPDASALCAALNAADMLVLAYGFDETSVQYYRYSFATKTVAYMMSGRCILAYGPRTIEPVAYLARGGWAHVVPEPGAAGLAHEIGRLMDDPALRERIARAAYEASLGEHDLAINSKRFQAFLTDIAGMSDLSRQRVARGGAMHEAPADA